MLETIDAKIIANKINATYKDKKAINNTDGANLPDSAVISAVLDVLFQILFPGFFGDKVTSAELSGRTESLLHKASGMLCPEISRVVNCRKRNLCVKGKIRPVCEKDICRQLLSALPVIRSQLKTDISAAFDNDPAAKSFEDIILSYPGLSAIATHRIAHELYRLNVPLIPRIMSERAHARTGIDIHPGAKIGTYFFIDHGTGVVIGETAEIGRRVTMYQGVTIGALNPLRDKEKKSGKRHPTIQDNVVIYAGATILGGGTVIGRNAVIGGNVWLVESVPPDTTVLSALPDNKIIKKL